jgi:hypothetical protein
MHLKAHLILEGLVEHGYVGIDERIKVCHLMESIETKALDSAKAQIMANANLRTNLNTCVTLLRTLSNKSGQPTALSGRSLLHTVLVVVTTMTTTTMCRILSGKDRPRMRRTNTLLHARLHAKTRRRLLEAAVEVEVAKRVSLLQRRILSRLSG